jgi:hypothetical protein
MKITGASTVLHKSVSATTPKCVVSMPLLNTVHIRKQSGHTASVKCLSFYLIQISSLCTLHTDFVQQAVSSLNPK